MARTESYRRWSDEEISYLTEQYGKATADLIAVALDRTTDSVWEKADRLGLRKHRKRHQRDPDGPWYCPECGKTKPKEEFNKGRDDRGSAYCKDCTNLKQAERRKKKKKNG